MIRRFKTMILALPILWSVAAQAAPNAPDIVVDAAGKGAFTSLQEAVMSVRDYKPTRTIIYVKNGVYNEKILIPANKCDITIIGESAEGVIIRHADYAKLNNMGTFRTWTLRIDGSGIRLENITVENNADKSGGQAVALHVEGDKCEFVGCRFLGNQDTVFLGCGGHRQYFRSCYIEGTVDFIFGPATAWFEACHVHCKADSYITAASTPSGSRFGFVFNKCRITADASLERVYLGRPWREFAAVIFMHCDLPAVITPAGWHNWGRVENEGTARYFEYENTGDGAQTAQRVEWAHTLSPAEADAITVDAAMQSQSEWSPIYDIKNDGIGIKD